MKTWRSVVGGRGVASVMVVLAASLASASTAIAGPVVREATGLNAAAIQAAVDLFRNDLGAPNNGATPSDLALIFPS